MKFHIKRFFIGASSIICIIIVFWNLFLPTNKKISNEFIGNQSSQRQQVNKENESLFLVSTKGNKLTKKFQAIDCLINEEYSINCLKSIYDNAVYIPFSFIKKYFEIDGKIIKRKDGRELFDWHHSYSKVFFPRQSYNYKGIYLWFENYNVEVRDRVKCVSAIEGVPISMQWESKGHFYPIQIAQFGLSHFSKNLTYGKPRVTDLDNGESFNKKLVQYISSSGSSIKRVLSDQTPSNRVLLVDGKNILKIKRKPNSDLTLSLQVKPMSNFSITAILKYDINSVEEFPVTYSTNDLDIFLYQSHIGYGIGTEFVWKSLTRDLAVDIQKGYSLFNKKLPGKSKNLHLIRLEFDGRALLDNIKLSSSAHEEYAKIAADWLLKNQDSDGGWPIKVKRKLSNGMLVLQPGWYSAMAQGQAMSLLVRMYHATNDQEYLNSAINAVNIFKKNSSDNGVTTYFIDKYIWYEEYPTTPSSFVLNGFIYSLFGLYDLKMSCDKLSCQTSAELYDKGVVSLKKMLSLFDSGYGSIYDLKHFSLATAPNIARWDYHSTHINQLLFINSIDNDFIFQTTAKRWISYMKGKRASHN